MGHFYDQKFLKSCLTIPMRRKDKHFLQITHLKSVALRQYHVYIYIFPTQKMQTLQLVPPINYHVILIL